MYKSQTTMKSPRGMKTVITIGRVTKIRDATPEEIKKWEESQRRRNR